MRLSLKVALGGIFMALCCLCMAATTLFPVASLALPAIAGVLLGLLGLLTEKKWAALCYAGVALLSFALSSDHTAVVCFVALLGYYPLLKGVIERLRRPVTEWILKMLLFNVAVGAGIGLTFLVFGPGLLTAEYSGFGKTGLLVFYLFCNLIFAVYDLALTRLFGFFINVLIPKYLHKLR